MSVNMHLDKVTVTGIQYRQKRSDETMRENSNMGTRMQAFKKYVIGVFTSGRKEECDSPAAFNVT